MVRDRIVSAIIVAFGDQLGGKRALGSTWNLLAKQFTAECAQAARDKRADTAREALTPAEKKALRDDLWPKICELAQAPDLMDRVVQQVQFMGVVNERELIVLVYIAATSRVLDHPLNVLAKGASSSGKSFTTTNTLELIGPDFVNHLTSSSALSLVYDDRPLAHTILFINEANQLQSDENSTFAMLVRSLISEGRIVHQTTVEDPDFQRAGALNGLCGKARSRSSSPPQESCTPRMKPACCLSKSVKVAIRRARSLPTWRCALPAPPPSEMIF